VPAQPVADEPPAAEPAPVPVPAWTGGELESFRTALEDDIIRLREELNMGAADMADLLADSGDGAGDDQADAGSKTLEREQEMSVNANARDLLDQSTHALRRLEAGTYGVCESCGTLIPAARLRAFPRATLCIACKQAEERR
jgi:RNA polymerase-binding protein DksA